MERILTSSQILGPGGPLSQVFDRYQARTGQMDMAARVEQALQNETVLFCEAGTGTGKTLAYLIPAVLSGKKVVISTATRALQEQIFHKDLLLVERALGRRVSAALMKGLGNYLCRRRAAEFMNSEAAASPKWAAKLRVIEQWQAETETGDFSELAAIGEGDGLLAQVASSSDTRVGSRCPHFGECFITKMRQEAEAAQILLVNHHLFFADLALRGPHPGRVIPDYDAVIFDEAHQIENVATMFFGVRVSKRRIQTLTSEAERLFSQDRNSVFSRAPAQVSAAADRLFEKLLGGVHQGEPRAGVERDTWAGPAYESYLELDTALEGLESAAEAARGQGSEFGDALESVVRRCQGVRDALSTIVEGAPGRIAWLDTEAAGTALSSTPVDLSDTLQELVFNRIPSVVLTSATLATSGVGWHALASTPPAEAALDQSDAPDNSQPSAFTFIRSRLGAKECEPLVEELLVPSPFDFKRHSLLYVPKDLPPPNESSFGLQALERIVSLVEAADGGAFVLTTSLRSMKQLHQGLITRMPGRRVLLQGSAPKHALLSAFRNATDAVLVATMGFWEGVDVPGESLRLVVLEKIPFSVPSDPIMRARAQALEEDGGNPFNELFVPLAQMSLKQGFGRLIRGEQDRGVVALLDSRVHRRGYGQRLLSQLPPAKRVVDLDAVVAFLEQIRPDRTA